MRKLLVVGALAFCASCEALGLGSQQEVEVTQRDKDLAAAMVAYVTETVADSGSAEEAKEIWVTAVRLWAASFMMANGYDPLNPPPSDPE